MDLCLPNIIFPWNELYSKIDKSVCQNISEDTYATSQRRKASPKKTKNKTTLLKNIIDTKPRSTNLSEKTKIKTNKKNQIFSEVNPTKEYFYKNRFKVENSNTVKNNKAQKQNNVESTRKCMIKTSGVKFENERIVKKSLNKNKRTSDSIDTVKSKIPKKDLNSKDVFPINCSTKNIDPFKLKKSAESTLELPQSQLKNFLDSQVYANSFPFRIEMNHYGNAVRVNPQPFDKTKYNISNCYDFYHTPVGTKFNISTKPAFVYQNPSHSSKSVNNFCQMPANFSRNIVSEGFDKKLSK